MGKTNISWATDTWNPVTGCSHVSDGCRFCYAEALSLRRGWSQKPWTAPNAAENIILHPDRLDQPLHWRAPRRVFVNSMSDLFHEMIPDEFIADVFAVMALATHHQFLALTKRPERMRNLLSHHAFETLVDASIRRRGYVCACELDEWPLPNVWVGTSVERQREADERIPLLLATPAAVRFLSCEPLLGPLDLTFYLDPVLTDTVEWSSQIYPTVPWPVMDGITWVIVGGESGPNYRPMNLDWARSLRDQCQAAGVSFFYKQGSGPRPGMNATLDGVEWHQYPDAKEAISALG